MKLNINAPLCNTSYGYVAQYIIDELTKTEAFDIKTVPIGQVQIDEKFKTSVVPTITDWNMHTKAACLKIWHQFDLFGWFGYPRIAYTIFELDGFTDREKVSMQVPDELIVCSNWAKEMCEKHLNREALVVPLGVDISTFKPYIMMEGRTLFGNFGKWEYRKGHDILVEAFNKAFEDDDDVNLLMMPHNQFLNPGQVNDWTKLYKNSKLGDKIQILNHVNTHEEVYNIMKYIHCGVFPSRAEGWNLEALELLACGKHLIITNCTAHKDFCNNENSMLIDVNSTEEAFDGVFFNGGGEWSSLDSNTVDQLVEHMRKVHKTNIENGLQTNEKGVQTAQEFTWTNSANKLSNIIYANS